MTNLLTPIVDETGKVMIAKVPKLTKKNGKEVEQLQDEELTLKKVIKECMIKDFAEYPYLKSPRYMKIKDEDEIKLGYFEKKLILQLAPLRFNVIVNGQIINILN